MKLSALRLLALCLFIVIAGCRKDKYTEPEPPVVAKTDTLIPGPTPDSLSLNTVFKSLDIQSILVNPSAQPISFYSLAKGREINGTRPTLHLASSGWTHPSVQFFEKPWNGYHYWAALTPYPGTDSQYENPHIFCSNDGGTWIEPKGILNPIEPCPPDIGFNSDVDLLLDKNILYCYWRLTAKDSRSIYVKKSSDGIHWSEKILVCKMPYGVVDVISPSFSFLKSDGKYYCYAVCGPESQPGNYFNKYSIRRMSSSDPLNFNPEKGKGFDLVSISGRPWGNNQEPWHLEVRKMRNLWMMLVTTTNLNGYGSGGRLFMGYSSDGINFSFGQAPIGTFTGSTYKSSFNPRYNHVTKKIHVEMWRAVMSYGWAVFYDKFIVNAQEQ